MTQVSLQKGHSWGQLLTGTGEEVALAPLGTEEESSQLTG